MPFVRVPSEGGGIRMSSTVEADFDIDNNGFYGHCDLKIKTLFMSTKVDLTLWELRKLQSKIQQYLDESE